MDPDGSGAPAHGHVRHVARQSAILLSSGVVGYAGALGLNVLLARSLGPSGFGAWVVAFAFAQTVATVGLFGADWLLLRQGSYYHGAGDTARLRKTIHLALTLSLSALGVMGVVLLALSGVIGRRVFGSQQVIPLLRLAALLGPVIGVAQIMLYGTQAFKSLRELSLVRNLVQPVARLAFVGGAILVHPSVLSAFVGVVAAEFVLAGTATFTLNRRIPLFGPTDPIDSGKLLRFAAPVWGSRLAETARGQLFPVLLGSLATLTASAAFVASRWVVVAPTAVIAAMNAIYGPMGSDLFLRGRRGELEALVKSIAMWSFTLAFPLFCLEVAFPKQVLSVFGAEFRGVDTSLVVLAVGMLFQFGTGPVTVTLIVAGRPTLALVDYLGVLAVEVGLGLWLIPSHGVLGAAIARAVGTSLNNVLPLVQVWTTLRIHPFRFDYWKPVAAGLGAAVAARLVVAASGIDSGLAAVGVAAVVLGGSYLVLLLALGLPAEDRAALGSLFRRAARTSGPTAEPRPAPPGVDGGAAGIGSDAPWTG